MHAVELNDVTKRFGAFTAVEGLSLVVPAGGVYGFIGPNGSGKTTTLRMIMRIYRPDEGRVAVLDDVAGHKPDDRVSYLPEERSLYKHMKVRDVVRFMSRLKSHNPTNAEIDAWLEKLGLAGWENKKVEQLSKGMNQKLQFICTVIHKPRLVLLDEVFSGLDPVNRVTMRQMILDLRKEGTTVIFSTHDMSTAEDLCDAILMIYKGRKVLDGTLKSIQSEYGQDVVRVRLAGATPADYADLPGVLRATDLGNQHELRVAPDADRQRILAELMRRGAVERFEIAHPSLQDIFVRIAGPELAPTNPPELVPA